MKKYIAALACMMLLTSLTACHTQKENTPDILATQTTGITTSGESTTATTATAGGEVTTTTATVGTTAAAPSFEGSTTSVSSSSVSATMTVGTTTALAEDPVDSSTTTVTKPTSSTTVTTTTTTTVPQTQVILPAVGTDIDVQKQKNRIRVSAASATYNADGSIAVSLTFQNYTSNWITEETDWVEYTCYDKNGNVVQAATKLHIGCIDTKKNPVRSYTFTVPAATAEVRLTDCKIVYWTEWV